LKSWVQTMITKMSEQMEKAGKVDMCKYLNCATFDIMGGCVVRPKDMKGQRLILFR
jgi:hypothetical protein